MISVEEYIQKQNKAVSEILQELHQLLTNDLDLHCKIRYQIPFYDHKSWVCYLNVVRKNGVELAFLHGKELSNEQGLLEPTERKMVAGVKFYEHDKLPIAEIREMINEAIILDELKHQQKKSKQN